ncbi:MAG: hypothetical protein ABIO36_09390 [Pyrinomonadaceae bacterium]
MRIVLGILVGAVLIISGCQNNVFQPQNAAPPTLGTVPAVRLNFRFEADVPAPSAAATAGEERNAAVQADFDASRSFELLDRTVASPDKKHVLAVYHHIADIPTEFRLDMYSPDGKLLKKLTSDAMAVHFPDTIVWSPDSSALAFVAMIRAGQINSGTASAPPGIANPGTNPQVPAAGNTNTAGEDANLDAASPTPVPAPTVAAPTGILTFRTEQIYTCGADGGNVKPLTENEGLIYFYYAWSPDSLMLVALAATAREWKYLEIVTGSKGETMVPQGRPRIIEKNGRERRLDDNMTVVRPVWSPDSTKVAAAFDTQIRIYDANGTNPTQAAIPLRNQLLISSQAYDHDQQRKLLAANTNADANVPANTPPPDSQPLSTLPDEKLLVSYNPIVEIAWTADDLLYLQTAYVKRMKNEADSVRSFSRWHRLALSAQMIANTK